MALKAANLQYVIGDAGLNSYREIVQAATPGATDAQVRIAADNAYAALLANGASVNGLYSLSAGSTSVYQAAADAELGRTATLGEVRSYAASRYAWFTSNRARTATPAAISATALLDATGAQTSATALGGSINAASVSVTATSKTSTENVALGIGVGGVGVGAALGYTTVADAISARLDQATVTTGSITVNASAIDGAGGAAAVVDVTAGAGAGSAAAGAAVAQGAVSNTISARLGGTLTVTGATTVSARSTQGSRADALGAAAAGGGALGVSLATSALDGTATAHLAANATLAGTSLAITASSAGISYASATAGAGGLLVAGVGADARATDSSRVEAHLGDNAQVNVGTGATRVEATATPDAKAAAYGVSVTGGLAVGVAISRATTNQTVIAAMDGGAAAQRALTAGNLSILATSTITGTPLTSIGGSPGDTGGFGRGGTGAAAWSFAGSGAYYASAVGSDARAVNTSTVTASAGNNVRLPAGIVEINATDATRQIASATGISVAGKYSVGAVIADARSSTTTSATLGEDARMLGNAGSSFSLKATGSDTQVAQATSGSGGLIAGAGASADTGNTATVTARIGARTQIGANTILVNASHTDSYASLVDATQAAALGASASLASHNATSDVLVDIGNTVVLSALGNGTRGCYVTSCLQGIELESRNIFTRLALGDTISAGAGGGINGVGAKSTTGIDGTSKVILGNDISFASGVNAVSSPGPIAIQAITELTADDVATLTTGGLLQGAGVTSQYRADTDNEVGLGTGNTLTSAGTINIGTYTTATVKTNAFVTTYGLAAVGVAEADTNIRTDQTITIGANSTLTGLDNVNVTAGRDASGLVMTGISGDASAVGYVRGLIAVPDADAATDLQNHARLNVNTGAALLSAQNVTLGAYNGTVTPTARGAGHGYQLYFIPVTQRDESPGAIATSTVVMNGRAVGGVYHEQEIIIGCGTAGSAICALNATPTAYVKAGGAPVTITYDPAFNAVDYVRNNYTTFNGTIAETAVADTLVGGIAQGLVKAYRLSQLYAAGGNVFVNGDTIQGNGSLTAHGGPSITVVNNSAAYLILDGGAYIPDLTTGQILFTGTAAGRSGLSQNAVNANGTASVIINNAYNRDDVGGFGPALLIAGDITNLGGLVSLNNTQGSFGFSGQRIDSLQFNVTVPNGAVAIASNGPNGMYNAGASPQAEWNYAISYPGGAPGTPQGQYNINDTVYAAANASTGGNSDPSHYLYGLQSDGPDRRTSIVYFGNCIGRVGAVGYNCVGGYRFSNNDIFFAQIPTVPLYRESYGTAQGSGSQIYGAQVAIKATIINVNASIEAGRVTDRSVTISADIGQSLLGSRNAYLAAGRTVVGMAELFSDQPIWQSPNTVATSFDFVNQRFIVDNTNASSGGGSVLLDGQIISTNTLGRIKINGGFGHVSIDNQSGLELVVNRINTGTAAGANAAVSKITIVDRLVTSGANTTVYAYTPGSGIAIYKTANGAQPILSGANATPVYSFISGDATSYSPVAGTRYEWTQQATLQKDGLVVNNRDAQGVWRYSSGSANNPWEFVSSPTPGQAGLSEWDRSAQTGGSATPQGRIVSDTGAVGIPFQQRIYGGHTEVINAMQTYGDCNGGNPSFCSEDFRGTPGSTANSFWNYNYVTKAYVQVTASVKADNPFGISFAGNASGLVTIISNASIRQEGNITNPSGATTITASAGSFTQGPQATILSNHLTITGRDSVGTADAAIKASLTSGAAIAAYSGAGGIHLDIDSDAKIWRLNANLDAGSGRYGDIDLRAAGGLEVASWADPNYTHALGNNITIKSRDGSVGGINTPLRIQAMATTLANGSQAGGVVNISAQGDIGIRQLSGNLRVGQIASTSGNVRVDVVNGTLKSASAQTAAQSLTTEQLTTISSKLRLTQADGADAAAQASIASFERNVTQTYTLYASLIRNGTVTGGVFTLSTSAIPLYQALANAALGRTADATEVRAYAAERYSSYAAVFSKAYGASWSSRSQFNANSLDSNFSFTTASPGAVDGLAGSITANAVWQTGQLVAAIDQAALQPASGVVGNGTAIIVGRDVSLNIGGSIGSLAPDVTIGLDAIRNGTLNTSQLQTLAVATTPGSVKLFGVNAGGQRVAVADINAVPTGVTLASVDIAQTAPLFISATGTFSGSAQGDIYLQSTTAGQSGGGSLNLGRVTATGAINLQAPQAITVATAQNSTTPLNAVQIQTGGDLTLSAAGGGIGSAATPLTYQIGGRLISASAGAGGAYLVKPTGDIEIGRIFAQGTASVTASAGSITSYLPGVAISGQSVLLSAAGNVGSQAAPLAVQTAATGEISGEIGGSAWLSTPTLATQSAIAMRIGALRVANNLSLSADAELRVLRSLTATNGGLSATAGSIIMASDATATAAGRITLASASNVTLGHVASALAAPQGTASISVTAAGAIAGNAGVVNLDAAQTGGVIALDAGNGIGTTQDAVTFAAPRLSARSLQGNVNLRTSSATHVAVLTADAGSVAIAADGALAIDALTSSGMTEATSSTGPLSITTLIAGGASRLAAAGLVTLGSATTTAGGLTVTSTGAGITAVTLGAAGALSLTAPGSIDVTTATSGAGTQAASSADTLTVTTLTAGAATTLSGRDGVMLGSAATTAGGMTVTSTRAGIAATTLTSAGAAALDAASTIDVASLSAGAATHVVGASTVLLGTATTSFGDLQVRSTGGSITATQLSGAAGVELGAAGAIAIGTLTSGGMATVTSTGGTLRIDTLSSAQAATLAAAGITLDSAETLAGDLIAASAAGIQARSLIAAEQLTLHARDLIELTGASSGSGMSVVSTAGRVRAATLRSGAAMTVEGASGIDLQSATAMSGDILMRSAHAGLALGVVTAERDIDLLAQGTVTATELRAGRDLSAVSQGATLAIDVFAASRDVALSAHGTITLADVDAGRNLSIVSSAAGITLRTARAGGTIGLDAAGLLAADTLHAGRTATLSGNALSIGELIASDTATLRGAGAVSLGSVSTLLGDIVITSTAGGINAASLDAAGALSLQAASAIQIGTARAHGAAALTSTASDVTVSRLVAGGDGRLAADGAVRLTDGSTGRALNLASARSLVSVDAATAGGDIDVEAQRIVFGRLDAGRDARLSSAGSIDGESIVATDTLTALAGTSGAGSVAIAVGAARNGVFSAPDDVRLGRYGAGDSIVILGNTIASDIVQLAGGSGKPLELTIAGSRQQTAERVTLSVDAEQFRTTRFETVDGTLTTTSRQFELREAFVPGALRLDAAGLGILANNRSPAPLNGIGVQLYQRNKPFFITLNGSVLKTDALIIRFDSGQVSTRSGNGREPEVSMARDIPRLGASMQTGPSFGEVARSFVLDETGRWRSAAPKATPSLDGEISTRVNLIGGGEQP